MFKMLSSITQACRFPVICKLCNQFHRSSLAVCSYCINLLQRLEPCCEQCADPLPDTLHPLCGACIKKPPHFDRALINYPFNEPLRSLIHEFKYHKAIHLAPLLGHLICHKITNQYPLPQCLIPIPLHPKRLRKRGFNQAALLTQYLAKQLQLPYLLNACYKVINTAPQAGLDADSRRKNLSQAFTAKALPYQHIALVDDLLTTGSTANALAKTLKKAGVQQVDIWCCARTVKGEI